jgi:hypothetical protein
MMYYIVPEFLDDRRWLSVSIRILPYQPLITESAAIGTPSGRSQRQNTGIIAEVKNRPIREADSVQTPVHRPFLVSYQAAVLVNNCPTDIRQVATPLPLMADFP